MVTQIPPKHPLGYAIAEFYAADSALRKMIGVGHTFADYEALWREVLRRLERVWAKTRAAVRDRPGWQQIESEVAHLRRTDPLLRYIIQARNVDEHSIQELAREYEANLSATPQPGSILLRWSPWDRPLLPVTNRGVTYTPPRMHLGKSISHLLGQGKAEPRVVAELAMEFYVGVLNRVSHEVVKGDYET